VLKDETLEAGAPRHRASRCPLRLAALATSPAKRGRTVNRRTRTGAR
jgi:hypothetical protein